MEQKQLIDTRTDRKKCSDALKARICARFTDVRRLLDNPARPRKAIVHDSINNIKAHFTNWLRIRRTAKEQEQNGNSTSKSQPSRHADLSVTATSAADYEGAF